MYLNPEKIVQHFFIQYQVWKESVEDNPGMEWNKEDSSLIGWLKVLAMAVKKLEDLFFKSLFVSLMSVIRKGGQSF